MTRSSSFSPPTRQNEPLHDEKPEISLDQSAGFRADVRLIRRISQQDTGPGALGATPVSYDVSTVFTLNRHKLLLKIQKEKLQDMPSRTHKMIGCGSLQTSATSHFRSHSTCLDLLVGGPVSQAGRVLKLPETKGSSCLEPVHLVSSG